MAFADNKAAKGQRPYDNPTGEKPNGPGANQSNQERGGSTGVRVVKPDTKGTDNNGVYMDTTRSVSAQAQFHENSEVTSNVLKDPLSRYMSKTLPAVQNPDAGNDRSYSRKAAGRVVGSKRTL